jgi:hypothetical protein
MNNYACYERRIHYAEILTSTFDSNRTSSTMVLFDFAEDDQQRIRHILLIVLLIHFHNTIRDQHLLLRKAIVRPSESPWRKLYDHADKSSFLHVTGLNRRTFVMLMEHVFDLEALARRRHGRPRLLGPEGYLGLLLFLMLSINAVYVDKSDSVRM